MDWLFQIHSTHPVAHAIGVLALVCVAGMAIGSIKVRGIGLGTAGVLFAGILVGSFGKPVDQATLDFVKEFGLVLFVFTIGLQLGPGFIASLRQQGLALNALAAAVVTLGVLVALTLGWLLGIDPAAVLGLLSGATTNTPSLGAVQQTLTTLPGVSPDRQELPALAYAVSYPVAIAGMIGTLLALKAFFRIDPVKEAEAFGNEQRHDAEPLERRILIVENPNLEGVEVEAIPGRLETGVTVSRIRHADEVEVHPASGTVLKTADRIVAVGTRAMLDRFQRVVGLRSDEDLIRAPGGVTSSRVVVTSKRALGRTVRELGLDHLLDVIVTRVTRADLKMSAVPSLRLRFGVQIVGDQASLQRAVGFLGNSLKALNEMHFIPLAFREFGIALFFAAVGLAEHLDLTSLRDASTSRFAAFTRYEMLSLSISAKMAPIRSIALPSGVPVSTGSLTEARVTAAASSSSVTRMNSRALRAMRSIFHMSWAIWPTIFRCTMPIGA